MAFMTASTQRVDSGAFTREQRDAFAEDGRRYEIIDGALIVTPAPQWRHQRAVVRLIALLANQAPTGLEVLCAPFDVAPAPGTVVQPDILIARHSDLTERDLPAAPLLAIEVLSPSTARYDLTLKRAVYEEMGCSAYWVVDPSAPSIRAWVLRDGRFDDAPEVTAADELYTTTTPCALRVSPAELT